MLHIGQNLARKDVGHHDDVKMMLLKQGQQGIGHLAVEVVNRRAKRQAAVQLSEKVQKAEGPRCVAHQLDIALVDDLVQTVAGQGIGVEHLNMVSALEQLVADCAGSGIVSAAGSAG